MPLSHLRLALPTGTSCEALLLSASASSSNFPFATRPIAAASASNSTCRARVLAFQSSPRPHHRVLTTSARSSAAALSDRQHLPGDKSRSSPITSQALAPPSRPRTPAATPRVQTAINQMRSHAGHSHGHGHSHDTTYLTSSNKSDPGVRITRIGLLVNLGMAVTKGAGGVVFHSQALLADALHALTDLLSDITTLATISYSIRPATPAFPLGYGKIESIGALTVSGILLAGGVGIGLQAVMALSQQFFPEIAGMLSHVLENVPLHSHSHGGHDHGAHVGPSIHAAWLAAGSIVVKEWLYRATMKVAKEKRSSVLSSNAYHHRVDSLTAFVALFTIVASNFLEHARWLDPVGGLIISGMIVQAGWGNTKAAVLELADASVDADVRESAHAAATEFIASHGATIRAVQGVKSGQNLMFDVEVVVPSDWSVAQCDQIGHELRQAVATKVRGTKRIVVRFTTKEAEAFQDEFMDNESTLEQAEARNDEHAGHAHEHTCDDSKHAHTNGHAANGTAHKRK